MERIDFNKTGVKYPVVKYDFFVRKRNTSGLMDDKAFFIPKVFFDSKV